MGCTRCLTELIQASPQQQTARPALAWRPLPRLLPPGPHPRARPGPRTPTAASLPARCAWAAPPLRCWRAAAPPPRQQHEPPAPRCPGCGPQLMAQMHRAGSLAEDGETVHDASELYA